MSSLSLSGEVAFLKRGFFCYIVKLHRGLPSCVSQSNVGPETQSSIYIAIEPAQLLKGDIMVSARAGPSALVKPMGSTASGRDLRPLAYFLGKDVLLEGAEGIERATRYVLSELRVLAWPPLRPRVPIPRPHV